MTQVERLRDVARRSTYGVRRRGGAACATLAAAHEPVAASRMFNFVSGSVAAGMACAETSIVACKA
jgi:hypothetical protein